MASLGAVVRLFTASADFMLLPPSADRDSRANSICYFAEALADWFVPSADSMEGDSAALAIAECDRVIEAVEHGPQITCCYFSWVSYSAQFVAATRKLRDKLIEWQAAGGGGGGGGGGAAAGAGVAGGAGTG